MSIVTKTGDNGSTSLMYGRRVAKSDSRIHACGDMDELNAALGLARAVIRDDHLRRQLLSIQKELVIVMGELSVIGDDRERYEHGGFRFVDAAMVGRLEAEIDGLERGNKLRFTDWVMPGDNLESAALDVARTVCRRAERQVASIDDLSCNPEILRYLNRLSDLCWLYARHLDASTNSP
jgi:cob(I)alamin adenosyltransferase